jgi:hypothetical protein
MSEKVMTEAEKVMMYEYIATYFIATCLIYDEEVNEENFKLYLGKILDDGGLTGITFEDVENHSSDIRKIFGVVQSGQVAVSVSTSTMNSGTQQKTANGAIPNASGTLPQAGILAGGVRRKVKTQAKGKGKTQPTKIRKNKRGGGNGDIIAKLRKFLKFMGKKNKVIVQHVAEPDDVEQQNSLYEYTDVESININLQELKLIDMLKLIALRKHNPANYPYQLKEFIAYLNGQDVDITTVNEYLQKLQDMQKQICKRIVPSPGHTMYNNNTFKEYIQNIFTTFFHKNDDNSTKKASSNFIISLISKVFDSTPII